MNHGINSPSDAASHQRTARWAALLLLFLSASAIAAFSQEVQVKLDPAQTHIDISVHDIHGGFHGSFRMKSGVVQFNRTTGDASGEIVVNANGNTGNDKRDRKMDKEVLETQRYPEITFVPKRVSGQVAKQGTSNIQVQGVFHIHGGDHELTLSIPVQVNGNNVRAITNFVVPYEQWGMKNPSVLLLRVDGEAEVSVSAAGTMSLMNAAAPH